MKGSRFGRQLIVALGALVAPTDAFGALQEEPQFAVAFLLTLFFRIADELAKSPVRAATGQTTSLLDIVISAVMPTLGWTLWIAFMFLIAASISKVAHPWKRCLAMAAHVTFVTVGVSGILECATIAVDRLLGIHPALGLLLPSLGWFIHSPLANAFASIGPFMVWGGVLTFLAQRRIGVRATSAWFFTLAATTAPAAAYIAFATFILRAAGG